MKKSSLALALVAAAGFAPLANATVVLQSTGLATYDHFVSFSGAALPNNTVITTQFAAQGLTFSALSGGALRMNSCGAGTRNFQPGFSGEYLNTYGTGCTTNTGNDSFSMKFASDVSASSFAFRSINYGGINKNKIAAYHDGVVLEQYEFLVAGAVTKVMTFSNMTFDEVRFFEPGGSTSFFEIDSVAFVDANAVPEPASLALFGLGLAGLAGLHRKRA